VTAEDWAPDDVDLQRPNAARVYDYYLGGSHNFAIDREMARKAIDMWPDLPMIIRANRAFLARAVRFLVRQGVRQFLDLGSGIPTVGSVHEIAQAESPDARVVYVDVDPVAVAHARMILTGNKNATVIQGDLRRPDGILGQPDVVKLLDLDEPVGVLMIAVLHFVPDADDPAAIIAGYRRTLQSDSYIAVSHASDDELPPQLTADHRALYARTPTPMCMRSHAQIVGLLEGWGLVEPGLVRIPLWRPDPGEELPADPHLFAGYAGVARSVTA
jgi:hypothetical protein